MGIPIWDYPPLNQPAEQNNAQPTFKRIKSPRCHQNATIQPPPSSSSSSSSRARDTVSPPPNHSASQSNQHASQNPIQPPQQQRQRQHRSANSRSYMTRLSDIPSRSSASNSTSNTSSSATAAALMHGDEINYDDPQDLYDEIERATEQLIRARERAVRDRQDRDRQDRPDRFSSSASASASSLLASTLPRLPAELAANVERYFYLGQEYHLPDLPRSTRRLPMPDRSLHHHSGRRLHHVPQPDIQGQMLTLAEFLRETSAAVARRDRDEAEQQRPNI